MSRILVRAWKIRKGSWGCSYYDYDGLYLEAISRISQVPTVASGYSSSCCSNDHFALAVCGIDIALMEKGFTPGRWQTHEGCRSCGRRARAPGWPWGRPGSLAGVCGRRLPVRPKSSCPMRILSGRPESGRPPSSRPKAWRTTADFRAAGLRADLRAAEGGQHEGYHRCFLNPRPST